MEKNRKKIGSMRAFFIDRKLHSQVLSLAIFLIGFAQTLNAQTVEIQGSVRENTVGLEELVTFDLEIKGIPASDLQTPRPPTTEGLRLVQGSPALQTKMNIINGVADISSVFSWRYRPEKLGDAKINSGLYSLSGKTYKTDIIEISVVPQADRPVRSNRRRRFADILDDSQTQAPREITDEDAFIRVRNSDSSVFLNEQVTLSYDLYVRDNIRIGTSRLADSWDASGFWREELETNPGSSSTSRSEVVKGLRYNVIRLKRVALFPTRIGQLEVEPLRIETELSSPNARTLPSLFFSRTTPFQAATLASPSISIKVLPLGETTPESYTGVSGKLSVNSQIDRTEVEVGEPIMYTISFRGQGKIATISEPDLQLPSLIEQYGPEVDYSINRSGTTISGSKKFEFTLIPRSGGKHTIPAITFSYFDTDQGIFRNHRTNAVTLNVKGEVLSEAEIIAAGKFPGNDIADLIPIAGSWVKKSDKPIHKNPIAMGMLGIPLLLLGLIFGLKQYTNYAESNQGHIRSKKAQQLANRHLKKANTELENGNWKEFYDEIRFATLQFISDRSGKTISGLSNTEISNVLREKGARTSLCAEFEKLMSECDQASFSPIKPTQDQLKSAVGRASNIIADLHDLLA